MATTFKNFQPNDVTSTRTLLHESVPLTGTLVSGTYGTFPDDTNIKTYSHGMFESVYDYPYLSSSANHIYDMAVGFHADTTASMAASGTGNPLTSNDQKKRRNIYNSMAQVLAGFDVNANLRKFDEDGNLTAGSKYEKLLFLNFSRLLYKDEIKKGSFVMEFYPSGAYNAPGEAIKITDYGAVSDYKINSPAGEFGVLYVTEQTGVACTADAGGSSGKALPGSPLNNNVKNNNNQFPAAGTNNFAFAGLIYYQAGVAVFPITGSGATNGIFSNFTGLPYQYSGSNWIGNLPELISSGTVGDWTDNMRQRIKTISFNNTTELNSSIYFCRVNHNDFNYSSNKSYLTASKIRVKNDNTDTPVSYLTTIGLYDSLNNLMATAKLSEPLKKTPDTELVLRVRLDY